MKKAKLALIIIVAVVVAGGGFALYSKLRSPRTTAQPQGRIVEVQRSNIETIVTASGGLTAPVKANLTFNSSGTIQEIRVDMGDAVKKGQVLARLDTLDLERAVRDAETGLKSAQKSLKDLMDSYDTSTVAQAEAAHFSAQSQAKAAQKALQDVQPPYNLSPYTTTDIAQAQAAVAAAQSQVKAAQQALQDVQLPYNLSPYTTTDIAQAEAAVAAAQSQVKSAENDLIKAQTSQTTLDIAHLQNTVDNAQKALDAAQHDLDAAITNRVSSVAAAQERLRQAQESYKSIIRLSLTDDTFYLDPRIILGTEAITDRLQTAYSNLLQARDNVTITQVQGDKNVVSAQAALSKAQDTLKKAQEDLARKLTDVPVDLQVKQYQLQSARASLLKAQEDLNKRKAGPEPLEVARRQLDLENAKASLIRAQEDLKKKKAGPEPLDLAILQAKVVTAQDALDKAKDNLAKATITAPFDGVMASVTPMVGDQVGASTVVMTMVDTRKLRLEAMLDETSVSRVRVGQEARISLDALPDLSLLGKVTAIGPVSVIQQGVVNYKVYISLESVSSGGTASSSRVRSGSAGGTAPSTGARSSIAGGAGTAGAGGGGATSQAIPPTLREGMTTLAELVTSQRQNVLLVPRQAVQGSGQNRFVKVIVNGVAQQKSVTLGQSNDQSIEIVSGLSDGDKMLIETQATRSINPVATPRGGFGMGGGIPGLR